MTPDHEQREKFAIPPVMPGRRRRLSDDQKRVILTEGLKACGSISAIGRRYDIPVTLLFRWKKELKISLDAPKKTPVPSPDVRLMELEARLGQLEQTNRALAARLLVLHNDAPNL